MTSAPGRSPGSAAVMNRSSPVSFTGIPNSGSGRGGRRQRTSRSVIGAAESELLPADYEHVGGSPGEEQVARRLARSAGGRDHAYGELLGARRSMRRASAPLLMTKSGHSSLRTLGKYARPGTEALAAWQQQTDRTRRGRD